MPSSLTAWLARFLVEDVAHPTVVLGVLTLGLLAWVLASDARSRRLARILKALRRRES